MEPQLRRSLKLKGSEQCYSFDHFNQQCGITKVWGKVNNWKTFLGEDNMSPRQIKSDVGAGRHSASYSQSIHILITNNHQWLYRAISPRSLTGLCTVRSAPGVQKRIGDLERSKIIIFFSPCICRNRLVDTSDASRYTSCTGPSPLPGPPCS